MVDNAPLTIVGRLKETKGILASFVTDAFQWTMAVLNVLTRRSRQQSQSIRKVMYYINVFFYESYEQKEVREVKYDGKFQWLYTFKRERCSYKEKDVFKTEKEVEEYMLRKHFDSLYKEMVKYKEKYKVLPSIDTKLLNNKNI